MSSPSPSVAPADQAMPDMAPNAAAPNVAAPDVAAPDVAPLLSVVVVSYNTRELTLRCLRELFAHLEAEALTNEVWVVDNGSKDGSAGAIARAFPAVHLLAPPENLGFGPANNLAFERAQGEFLLLLNTDAFLHAGALSRMVEVLRDPAKARVGAVGPQLRNEDGSLQRSCWKFPSPARSWIEALGVARAMGDHPRWGDYYRWAHDERRSVDFVIGACLLVRREVYEEIGGFDPAFFLYAEESDWQKRMREHGWDIVFTPDAQVTHLGGASGAGEKARVSRQFWQGQERYVLKHFGRRGWATMRAGAGVGVALRTAAYLGLALHPKRRAHNRPLARAGLQHLGRLLSSGPPSIE